TTMVWNPRLACSALPICSVSRSNAVRSWPPLAAEGVPTQMNDTSVSSTARSASCVTLTRPESTTSRISSWMPSSRIGDLRARIRSSLARSTSTPISRCPSRARQAIETAPTYPSPKTLMRFAAVGLPRRLPARGLSPFSSAKMGAAPTPSIATSGEPASVPLVVSTFVPFLGAIEHHAQQIHLGEHFLGTAQHGAAALALRHHQQQRIELRRECQHVVGREQRRHVEHHDAPRHFALQRLQELAHARRVQELRGVLEGARVRDHAEALGMQLVDDVIELGLAEQVVGQALLETHAK